MRRNLVFIIVLICTLFISQSRTEAATTITVTGANKVYSYAMRGNTTLNTIVSGAPTHVFVESAKQYVVFYKVAPADLRTIYTTLQARIFVDHANKQFTPLLIKAPTTLQAIYTTLAARVFVDHADAQFVPVLVPIILDNGVPTGTVARGATQPDQTPRPSMTSTPTATPTVEERVVPSESPVPTVTLADSATTTIEPTATIEPIATTQP